MRFLYDIIYFIYLNQ